jgi:hypothetical protein
MAFAQTAYLQLQGRVSPSGKQPVFRIDQIGCFLTSFCNLLLDYGVTIDPPTMNAYFRDNKVFVDVDDGVFDDLGWSSISAYKHDLVVTGTGTGWPQTNSAIVKFIYQSVSHPWLDAAKTMPNIVTHFCKVADYTKGLILDSWDGRVKAPGPYGQPKGYATYGISAPAAITPPVPVAAPSSNYDGNDITILAGWGLSHAAQAAGFPDWQDQARWQAIAELNGSTSWVAFNKSIYAGQRIHVGKYTPPAPVVVPVVEPTPPTPVPTPEPVVAPEVIHTLSTPVENVSPPAEPVVVTTWKDSYQEIHGMYVANEDITVKDIEGLQIDIALHKGQTVPVAGVFERDGKKYYRTERSLAQGFWYGLPEEALTFVSGTRVADAVVNQDAQDALIEQISMDIIDTAKQLSLRERIVGFVARVQSFFVHPFKVNKK